MKKVQILRTRYSHDVATCMAYFGACVLTNLWAGQAKLLTDAVALVALDEGFHSFSPNVTYSKPLAFDRVDLWICFRESMRKSMRTQVHACWSNMKTLTSVRKQIQY